MGGVKELKDDEAFSALQDRFVEAFNRTDIPEVIHLMDENFDTHSFSLWHLFKDEQRKIFNQILGKTLEGTESSFRQIWENCYTIVLAGKELGIPLPGVYSSVAEFLINTDLQALFEKENFDPVLVRKLMEEMERWSVKVDARKLNIMANEKVNRLMELLADSPQDLAILETINSALAILKLLPLELNLWKAQNIYFHTGLSYYPEMKTRAMGGDESAGRWIELFEPLGEYLKVRKMA
jgi:hypothetical protein